MLMGRLPLIGGPPAGVRNGLAVLGEAQVWWAVDDVGNTITSGNVETLANKGVAGTVDATQATATKRPAETDTSGIISAEYDGSDDSLVATSGQFPANIMEGGGTMVFVARPDTDGGASFGRLFEKGDDAIWLDVDAGGAMRVNYRVDMNTGNPIIVSGVDAWTNGSRGILDIRCDVDTIAAASDVKMFLNGADIENGNQGSFGTAHTDESGSAFWLGNREDEARCLDGGIYEAAFWNTELSDSDMALVRTHLADKYSVTLA